MTQEVARLRLESATDIDFASFADPADFELRHTPMGGPRVKGFIWKDALYLLIECYGQGRLQKVNLALFRIAPDGSNENLGLEEAHLRAVARSSIVPTPAGLMLIPKSTWQGEVFDDIVSIKFIPSDGRAFGELREIAIEQDLPLWQRPQDENPFFRDLDQETGEILFGHPMDDGFVVAMPFRTAAHVKSIVFLKLDGAFQTGKWQRWWAERDTSAVERLKRLLRTPRSVPLQFDDLLSLRGDDYPVLKGFSEHLVWPLEVMMGENGPIVFSRGANESTKHGAFGAVLGEIEQDGRIHRQIFFEDHTQSSKKHAFRGAFVNSGKAFLIHSEYKTTDPWGGGWAYIRLSDGQLTVLPLPRSYKGIQALDVEEHGGWFYRPDSEHGISIFRFTW